MKAEDMLMLVGGDQSLSLSRANSDGLGSFGNLFSDEASQAELQKAMAAIADDIGGGGVKGSPDIRRGGSSCNLLNTSSPLLRCGSSFGSLAAGYPLHNARSSLSAANGWSERALNGCGSFRGSQQQTFGCSSSVAGPPAAASREGGGGEQAYLSGAPATRMMLEALARGGTPGAAAAAAAAAVSSGRCGGAGCGDSSAPIGGAQHAQPRLQSPHSMRSSSSAGGGNSNGSDNGNGSTGWSFAKNSSSSGGNMAAPPSTTPHAQRSAGSLAADSSGSLSGAAAVGSGSDSGGGGGGGGGGGVSLSRSGSFGGSAGGLASLLSSSGLGGGLSSGKGMMGAAALEKLSGLSQSELGERLSQLQGELSQRLRQFGNAGVGGGSGGVSMPMSVAMPVGDMGGSCGSNGDGSNGNSGDKGGTDRMGTALPSAAGAYSLLQTGMPGPLGSGLGGGLGNGLGSGLGALNSRGNLGGGSSEGRKGDGSFGDGRPPSPREAHSSMTSVSARDPRWPRARACLAAAAASAASALSGSRAARPNSGVHVAAAAAASAASRLIHAEAEASGVARGSSRASSINRRAWSAEEDETIRKCVEQMGMRWRVIAPLLPGRSDDSVRNRWKRLKEEADAATGAEWLQRVAVLRPRRHPRDPLPRPRMAPRWATSTARYASRVAATSARRIPSRVEDLAAAAATQPSVRPGAEAAGQRREAGARRLMASRTTTPDSACHGPRRKTRSSCGPCRSWGRVGVRLRRASPRAPIRPCATGGTGCSSARGSRRAQC